MEHTKGPWRAIKRTTGGWAILTVGRKPITLADSTEEADARLIAAAPDLYQACRAALGLITGGSMGILIKPNPDHYTLEMLKAAINKAEGADNA